MTSSSMSFMACRVCGKELYYSHSDTTKLLEHITTDHPEIEVLGFGRSDKNLEGAISDLGSLAADRNAKWLMELDRNTERETTRKKLNKKATWKPDKKATWKPDKKATRKPEKKASSDSILSIGSAGGSLMSVDSVGSWSTPATRVMHLAEEDGEEDKRRARLDRRRMPRHSPPPGNQKLLPPRKKKMGTYEQVYRTTVESWGNRSGKFTCPSCQHTNTPLVRRHNQVQTNSALGRCFLLVCWPLLLLPWRLLRGDAVNLYCPICDHYLGTQEKDGAAVQRPPTPLDVKRDMER